METKEEMRQLYLKNIVSIDRKIEEKMEEFNGKDVDPLVSHLAAAMSGRRTPTERKKELVRSMYLEAFLTFMSVYAESEMGNATVDITRIATYIHGPDFALHNINNLRNMDDCYRLIEKEVLEGLPIWRFLKLDEHLLVMLEIGLREQVIDAEDYARQTYVCKRCKHMFEQETNLGYLCRCESKKRNKNGYRNRGYHDYTKIKTCKFLEEK